jgi:O-glycosyl hydrolase
MEALEARTLLAVNVTVNFAVERQMIRGLGGDAARVVWAPDTAASDPVGEFATATLAHTVMRVGLPWKQWEPVNDDGDANHIEPAGFVDAGKVRSTFQYLQQLKSQGITQIIGTAWEAPGWMLEPATNPLGGPTQTIAADKLDEAAESLTALLVRARDVYGVGVPYLSFNESNFGIQIFMSSARMAQFIAIAGARFAAAGLNTKWLVGDTFSTKSLVDYAKPILDDAAARPYLGPISYHSWWSETESDSVFTAIADLASQYGKEVWSPEVGYDALLGKNQAAFATWDNALRLATIYNRVLKQSRATVALYWEYQVVGGGDVNDFPLASSSLTPYPAYYVLKQLSDELVPGARVVQVASDDPSLLTLAARDPATGNYVLQVINTGATASAAGLHGLPAGATFAAIRSSAGENNARVGTVVGSTMGDASFTFAPKSVTLLTTRGVTQGPTPFGGAAFAVPASGQATLQLENFDEGGEGVAYHDLEAANLGGANYRAGTGVDLETSADAGGGFDVGYAKAGEWLSYTVNVASAGTYDIGFRVANAQPSGGTFHLDVDAKNVSGPITVPNTGGWQKWTTVNTTVDLPAGRHALRLVFEKNGSWGFVGNFNYVTFKPAAPARSPFKGAPFAIGATIEAEDFDNGGQGVAFNDTTAANEGGKYRSTGVDIEATTDVGGGYNVGFAKPGEWLEYTVDVASAGNYVLDLRLANRAAGGVLHVDVGGSNKTGAIAVPNTGGWQNWQTVSRTISLSAGVQVLRVAFDVNAGSGYVGNLNWLRLTRV